MTAACTVVLIDRSALQVYLVTVAVTNAHGLYMAWVSKDSETVAKCLSLTHADWPSTSAALVALVTKSFLIAKH